MSRQKRIWLILLIVALLVCSGICLMLQDEAVEGMTFSVETEKNQLQITEADRNDSKENAVQICCTEQGAEIQGEGASYGGGKLLITSPGTYLLNGNLDGRLEIYVYADESVHLVLDNFTASAYDGPALWVKSASKIVITAKEGTCNTFTDTAFRAKNTNLDGCVYSVADITFNGTGSLDIYGYYKDAVASKGTVKFVDGNYTIWAADDGVRGRDGVVIAGGSFDIQAEGTGIKATHETNEKKGSVLISGGEFSVIAGEHAVSAVQTLQIENCRMNLRSVQEDFLCMGQKSIAEECVNYDGNE